VAEHSRSKNGVASLAYVPAIHVLPGSKQDVDARVKPAHDGALDCGGGVTGSGSDLNRGAGTRAIGLMSGPSLDGVDVALFGTDGEDIAAA
jgi:hypothetical protein